MNHNVATVCASPLFRVEPDVDTAGAEECVTEQ